MYFSKPVTETNTKTIPAPEIHWSVIVVKRSQKDRWINMCVGIFWW